MKQITPKQVDAAMESVQLWLHRGQDAYYEIEDRNDDTLIKIDGWVSLRHIVVEALEGGQLTLTAHDVVQWATERWFAEVANRPLQNVHRRSLDDTWRQIIRHFGGDDKLLCGPAHDELL